jgi:hypothetical protein
MSEVHGCVCPAAARSCAFASPVGATSLARAKDAVRGHHQPRQRADNQLVGIGFRRLRPLGLLRAQDRELGLHPFLLLLGQHGAVPG